VRPIECGVSIKKYKELNEDGSDIDYSALEVEHIKCMLVDHNDQARTISYAEFQRLNYYKSVLEVNDHTTLESNKEEARLASAELIKNLDLEQKWAYVARIEGLLVSLTLQLKQDPNYRKELAKDSRDKKIAKETQETRKRLAKQPTRTVEKSEDDIEEFTKKFPELESTNIKKEFDSYIKMVKMFMGFGKSEVEAGLMADETMRRGIQTRKNLNKNGTK
jgi:hypothetical protein